MNIFLDHEFVIPIYGTPPNLEACIRSILSQSVGTSKLILSTSTPSNFLRSLGDKYGISVLENPRRAGIGSDWNFAMTSCKASFITIAHQDDVYDARYLETMGQLAQAHPEMIIAFSDYCEHTDFGDRSRNVNLRVKSRLRERAFGRNEAIASLAAKRRLLNLGNPICCPSVLLNRARIPDFRFSESMKTNLDWDAWLRLAEMPGEYLYTTQRLVSKRVHPDSETSFTIANRTRQREDKEMFERFWPKPVAAMIMALYWFGYRANRV